MSSIADLEAKLKLAHPWDWSSWLVYADWLSDRGDIRGQLIALYHRMSLHGATELQRQIESIEQENREQWLMGYVPDESFELEWRYGFVFGVKIRWTPAVCAHLEALIAHPAGWWLTNVDLSRNEIDAKKIASLLRSEVWRSVRSLDLRNNAIGDTAAMRLARAEVLDALCALNLNNNHIANLGVQALAASTTLRSLQTLGLSGNAVHDEGALAFVYASLPALTTLHLYPHKISREGIDTLKQCERLRGCNVVL